MLHAAVGRITESDVQLAKASAAFVMAFNVRATAQAREMASTRASTSALPDHLRRRRRHREAVQGKMAPKAREKFLGYAEVRKVFNITRAGKVAGCMVTDGLVKRGAGCACCATPW